MFKVPYLKKRNFFVECLASLRNIFIACFFTRHILDRYPYYNLRESEENQTKFNKDAIDVLQFLNQSILNLFEELHSTGVLNGLNIQHAPDVQVEFTDIEINKRLPCNVAEDEVKDEEDRIIEVCEKIKHVSKLMNDIKIHHINDVNKLKLAVLQKFNENPATAQSKRTIFPL